MTKEDKVNYLVSPEILFPTDLQRGNLLGNKMFIEAMEQYLNILTESQYWPLEQLEEIQNMRLRKLVSNISNYSVFWKNYFDKHKFLPNTANITDLSRLPILRRTDLLAFGNKIYIKPRYANEHSFIRYSSGTTGVPIKISFSEQEMLIEIACLFRHPVFEKVSLKQILSRKPFVVLGLPGFSYICRRDFFSSVFPSITTYDLDDIKIRKEIYNSIIAASPAILVGFGSLVAKLAYWVAEDKVSLPLLAIRISSESISVIERNLIEKNFNAPVINILSGNGHITIGFECPINSGRFHVNSESVILEIVNDGNTENDEGELVATALTYMLTPRIRWAHNDNGRILPETCPCDRTLPLFEFHGRRGYEIALPSGRRLRWILLHTSLMRAGLGRLSKQIQIIQDRTDNLRILIVPRLPFSDSDELNIRLACTTLFNNEKINIEIKYVNEIIQNGRKPKFFIPLSESNAKDSQEDNYGRLKQ